MASQKDLDEIRTTRPADTEVDFAGYDPYIVALTGADLSAGTGKRGNVPDETTESRKASLLSWLKENGA